MIRSMTGFGVASGPTAVGLVHVELRAVNHRYLNVNTRLPTQLVRWEPEIREWLRAIIARGHVNCSARFELSPDSPATPSFRVDEAKVESYLKMFRSLAERFEIPGTIDLALLSRFNDIFVRNDAGEDAVEVEADELRPIVEEAAAAVVRMREDEGKRLEADLRLRLQAIENALARIETRAPDRMSIERNRMMATVTELLAGAPVDESRIAHEIAMLAERLDIHEELVRFRSHNELFAELLDTTSAEAVGKRMSFLVQEMHREANTIGSKANHAPIAHDVVAIKDELERLREQVENVE